MLHISNKPIIIAQYIGICKYSNSFILTKPCLKRWQNVQLLFFIYK